MSEEEALFLSMKTIMQTLDTISPELDKLVLAVVDKRDEEDKVVRFRYLSGEEKKKLVEKVNAEN